MTNGGEGLRGFGRGAESPSARGVCQAFEQAWDAGRPRSIESLLVGVDPADRRALLFGLLRREISYRRALGEVVTFEQYRARFERDADLLTALLPQHDALEALLQRCGYELLERIESGRAGDVYRVWHRDQQRLYAVKVIPAFLVRQDATRSAILQFIEDLRTLPAAELRNDLVIISLSGHGLQDLDGSLYFLPSDYRPGSLLSTGLSIDLFQSKLRMLGANVLLIIDTCYSGAARREGNAELLTRTTHADIRSALRRLTDSETALAVLVAGKARQQAGESQLFGGHGALTAAVLEFLTQRQFDVEAKDGRRPTPLHGRSPSGLLTLEDLRRYVVDRVAQFPMIDQRPNLYTTGERIGDYWCGDIPLRFVADRSKPDQEAGSP